MSAVIKCANYTQFNVRDFTFSPKKHLTGLAIKRLNEASLNTVLLEKTEKKRKLVEHVFLWTYHKVILPGPLEVVVHEEYCALRDPVFPMSTGHYVTISANIFNEWVYREM